MNIFGRPKNKWGRARLAGAVALAGVIFWTLAAAVLRGMPVPWMAWSGYPHFTLVRGLEAAVIPLGVLVLFRWLEEEEFKAETERIRRREHERSAGMRRGEVLQRFEQAVQAVLPGGDHSLTELPDHDRLAIAGIIRETLPELDGKGRGEMLSFLHARGLLAGENPLIELNAMDFSAAVAGGAQFDGICLESVNLRNGQLDGAKLAKSRLNRANLNRAFLRGADLREAMLKGCNLEGARLEGANLEGADLRGARLESAFLMNANLKNCVLHRFQLKEPKKGEAAGSRASDLEMLQGAVLIDTLLPDGQKVTNEKGDAYLREKEFESLVDKL